MNPTRVTVATPSRLHFGLYALEHPDHAFGGVGMMIERPAPRLAVRTAERFGASGPLSARIEQFARRAAEAGGTPHPPAVGIEVVEAPPEHAGLGSGTQLGLAVAAGLDVWTAGKPRPAAELAVAVGRGRRSAVGTHGFDHGGLIIDGGRRPGDRVGRLEARVAAPADWRVLLVSPPIEAGLSGQRESDAFRELPPVPEASVDRMRRLARQEIAAGAAGGDFERFAGSVGEYGRLAGECFATVQGGVFASPEIERLVVLLNGLGATGAGQSSWGPTVFALAESEDAAERLLALLNERTDLIGATTRITRPNNTGARIAVEP